MGNITSNCIVCGQKTKKSFDKTILGKYFVSYYMCTSCNHLQTEKPFWLDEAYKNAITDLDLGLLGRNIQLVEKISNILRRSYNQGPFLDYAGGYGVFTRLMRDKGFDYYHFDPICQNIFAVRFAADLSNHDGFEVVTAFEFFEHVYDPVKEVLNILAKTDTLLFTTELQPGTHLQEWKYIAPETGQHISFFSMKSLQKLAELTGTKLFSNGRNLHMLTRRDIVDPIKKGERFWYVLVNRLKTLATRYDFTYTLKDAEHIRKEIQ